MAGWARRKDFKRDIGEIIIAAGGDVRALYMLRSITALRTDGFDRSGYTPEPAKIRPLQKTIVDLNVEVSSRNQISSARQLPWAIPE